MSETYDAYRDRLIGRHRSRATSTLSTVGDVVMVGGVAAGALVRRPRVMAGGLVLGLAVAAFAHLFQRGTLGEELWALGRHPIWATRAESERVFRRAA